MRSSLTLAGIGVVAVGGGLLFLGLSNAEAQPARGTHLALASGSVSAARALSAASVEALEAHVREAKRRATSLAEHVRDMPDLTQTDPDLGVAGGGDSWCGPVAVSNAVMWLAGQGRETLVPSGATERERQLELVRRLGSGRFMGTTTTGGTGTGNLLTGLDRYMKSTGWGYERLEYQGWRGHPYRFSTGVKTPELAFIEKALADGGVVVIHAGWYTPSKYNDAYRRHGGHWLTVVGVGIDSDGRPAADALVLNDPAPYAGNQPEHSFVRVKRLDSGWLMAEDGAFPAKGYFSLGGGMHIKRAGDVAILDGVVALVP
jgi:hypothetical protein